MKQVGFPKYCNRMLLIAINFMIQCQICIYTHSKIKHKAKCIGDFIFLMVAQKLDLQALWFTFII